MTLSWANRMTILRILLVVPFVIFMLKINSPELNSTMQNLARYVAFAIFLVMAVSDALDGYLARKNRQVTRLGAFLDPVADKLLITAACLLLSSQRGKVGDEFLLPATVVVLIIGKDLLLVLGFVIVYFITSQLLVAPVLVGKTANALQLIMVGAILAAPEISQIVPGWSWVLRVLWWSAAGTAVLAMLVYIRNGSRYIEEYEPNQNRNASHEP